MLQARTIGRPLDGLLVGCAARDKVQYQGQGYDTMALAFLNRLDYIGPRQTEQAGTETA